MPPGKGRREKAIERRKVMSTHPAFCSHPGGIPEVRWHCVQHTEPDQDALHGFVCLPDSWTQVPQVFQVPQHSTRAVMAACVSILSLLMSFLFFAQLRAAVKSAVFGIGHSHRGRLDAVSQKLFVQSLRQILLQLCRKNGHLTIFSNAIWRKSICVKSIDFKIYFLRHSSVPTFRRRECWPGFSARDIETLVTLVTTFKTGLSSFFSWNFGGQLFGGLGEDCWDCWVSASDEVWCLSKWTSLNKTKWTCSTWWLWLCDSASRSEHGEIHTEYNSDEESCHRKIPGGNFHGYFETFSDVTSTCAMGPRGHGGHVWPGVTCERSRSFESFALGQADRQMFQWVREAQEKNEELLYKIFTTKREIQKTWNE